MAERLTVEHYVGECFLKCAQVILASRVFVPDVVDSQAQDKRINRWVSTSFSFHYLCLCSLRYGRPYQLKGVLFHHKTVPVGGGLCGERKAGA